MSQSRFNALDTIQLRPEFDQEFQKTPSTLISSFFGSNTFNDEAMKKYMSEDAYLKVKSDVQTHRKMSIKTAATVAEAMKTWAMDKGATHYTHWFQPLTGKTAEKHDAFFTLDKKGNAIEKFGSTELVQQEPDGSSFPGGGLRSTAEARGYTAWDASSPAFIMEVGHRKTLCIPTIFITYHGESLDYKLPLLKSLKLLNDAAVPVAKLFDNKVKSVFSTLGWEQEYFLIDEALFNARPDLVLTGRTLLGAATPKGQELDDHYFGSIPERVYAYMTDLETECFKLGIPIRTRHNEVGPGQFEFAPMFEEINVAVDHNQLLMDMMDRVAKRHHFRVLLHEKPFEGVNGSGKHNNWSMATDTGKNLLSPGKTPGKDLQFLTFFVNAIAAVHKYDDVLRASVATVYNDHRLGGNEAPPAIISVFIGSKLTEILDTIEKTGATTDVEIAKVLSLLDTLPDLELNNTDRNRTSPFAFTGNRFEFRMPGSSVNSASPMTALNAMMAVQLKQFKKDVDALITKGSKKEEAILKVLKKYIKASKKIRFEGDNYSDAWVKEAKKRGLNNLTDTPRAVDAYTGKMGKELFVDTNILSKRELKAHHNVMLENYITNLEIESRVLAELCMSHVIPSSVEYQTQLAQNVVTMIEAGMPKTSYATTKSLAKDISNHVNAISKLLDKMSKEKGKAAKKTERAKAIYYADKVLPLMRKIRVHADALEVIVDDKIWSLVKYREMMFLR